MLSIILIHPLDRSVVQVEVSVVLLFFLTKVEKEKISLANSLLVASSAHICWVGLMLSIGEFPATSLFSFELGSCHFKYGRFKNKCVPSLGSP